MSGISFQGIGSGMPVDRMIEAILQVKQKPIDRLNAEVNQYNTRISDLGKLSNLLNNFTTSLDPFRILKTAFKEQYSVENSNENLLTVTKKEGYNLKEMTSTFKLLDLTTPSAERNWGWTANKVAADFKYKGSLSMNGVGTLDFNDKAYTLDEMIEKINTDATFSDKLVAKKVLVNQFDDETKNTYALRLESKVSGDQGILNNPIFAANQVTNPGATPVNPASEIITGGVYKTSSPEKLNARNPTYELDISNYPGKRVINIFYDKNGNGQLDGFFGSDERISFESDKPNQNFHEQGFKYEDDTVVIENIGDDKLRVTQKLDDATLENNQVAAVIATATDRIVAAYSSAYPSERLDFHGYIKNVIHDQYDGNGDFASAGHVQPNLKQNWVSNSITAGTTFTEDTKLKIDGAEIELKDKTLQQVRDAINSSTVSHRVEAQVVNDGHGNEQLFIVAKGKGEAGHFNVKVDTSAAPPVQGPSNELTINHAASQLSDLDAKDLQVRFTVNGQEYTRNSYDLDTSKIPGLEGFNVKINPKAFNLAADDREAIIVATKDKAETKKHTKAALQGFVDAYNQIVEFVNTQTQVEVKDDGRYAGSLQNDSTLKSILESLDKELARATGGDLKHSLAMMGVMHVKPKKGYSFGNLDKDSGKLEIKDDLFERGLENGDFEKAMSGFKTSSGAEVKGYADRFHDLAKWMTTGRGSTLAGFGGLIDMRQKTLNSQKEYAKDQIERMKTSMEEMRERLVKQFNFADRIAAQMNSINATLARQLGNSNLISSAMGKF